MVNKKKLQKKIKKNNNIIFFSIIYKIEFIPILDLLVSALTNSIKKLI